MLAIGGQTSLTTDVLVIGSGAGGGVVAAELAAAGKDVLVVDKGDYFADAEFPTSERLGMSPREEGWDRKSEKDRDAPDRGSHGCVSFGQNAVAGLGRFATRHTVAPEVGIEFEVWGDSTTGPVVRVAAPSPQPVRISSPPK